MTQIFEGKGPVFEAASAAFSALFEGGGGMVKHTMDRARDSIMAQAGLSKDEAEDLVRKTRNIFFDGFAAPGTNPVNDPEFKRMMPLFSKAVYVMHNMLDYGTPDFDMTRALDAGVKFVNYMRGPDGDRVLASEHPGDEVPWDSFTGFEPETSVHPEEWDCREVRDYDEMCRLSETLHLGKWCVVQNEPDWDTHTRKGGARFFVFTRRPEFASGDYNDVLGVVVSPYGKVLCAYNRGDRAVISTVARELVHYHGVDEPVATVDSAWDLMNRPEDIRECDGKDTSPEAVFREIRPLGRKRWLVTTHGRPMMNVLCQEPGMKYSFLTDWKNDIEPFGKDSGCLVLDGKSLYDMGTDTEVRIPKGFEVFWRGSGEFLDGDGRVVPLRKAGGKEPVNALCISDRKPTLLLQEENDVPLLEVECHDSPDGYVPATFELSDGKYLLVTTGEGMFVMDSPQKPLADCPRVPPEDSGKVSSISRDGVYVSWGYGAGGRKEYFLKRDGNDLVGRGYAQIDWPEDGDCSYVILCDWDGSCSRFPLGR